MLIISLCYIKIISTLSSSIECYDAGECESQELSGDILCYGYLACQSSSITSSYYLPCVGYKSCLNSKITSVSTIACDGDYACSNAQLSSPGIIRSGQSTPENSLHCFDSPGSFTAFPIRRNCINLFLFFLRCLQHNIFTQL